MKSKKGATGVSIMYNLLRFVPVVILILFMNNILYSDLGDAINEYDNLIYHQMSKRILFNEKTTIRNGLINFDKLNERTLSDVFHQNLVVCYNFDFDMNEEFICNRDIDYDYEKRVARLRKKNYIDNSYSFLAPIYKNEQYFISNITFYVLGDYDNFN